MSLERKRQMIDPAHPSLSVVRKCELVSISRSGFYYRTAGGTIPDDIWVSAIMFIIWEQ